ncbi:MAG: TFIIB-type zinc ribbon-containing protein, partial [Candidatus Micrarchaeia archaeon]
MIYSKCTECGSSNLKRDSDRGEIVCQNCGLVIEENLVQEGPEWRAFDAEQRASRARTGAPLKYMSPNKGLVTEIDQYNRDVRGGKIAPSQQAQLYRMRKWHKRASISNSVERNLAIA